MRAGIDRQVFARLLARIGWTLRPAFNILDGILAMEGQGPGIGGSPREMGLLLAGANPFALDRVVCRMLDLDPEQVPILKAAREMGLPPAEAKIDGSLPHIRDFRLPRLTSLVYGPRVLQGFIRRQVLQRPLCRAESCRMCGACWQICPAGAIKPEKKPLWFDYGRCIRCYCCIEVCPFGAIGIFETMTGKIVRLAASLMLPPGKTQ